MFKKATRKQSKLKLALAGVSGAGKTTAALRIATGMAKSMLATTGKAGKIAVIDTENGSASLYANNFDFDVCEVSPPYTVEAYEKAIHAAEKEYDIIIIDSISHQWKGEGGILHKKEQLDSRNGANFQNWAKLTPEQDRFTSLILHSSKHTISTLRSKQEYAMVQDGNKSKVQKMGLAPIQRDGLEYEFTAVLDIAINHEAEASKDRTGLFDGKIFKITEETGKQLMAWLESGEAIEEKKEEPKQEPTKDAMKAGEFTKEVRKASEAQIKRLFAIQKGTKWTLEDIKRELKRAYGIESTKEMTMAQYDEVVDFIQKNDPPQDGPPALDTNEKIS